MPKKAKSTKNNNTNNKPEFLNEKNRYPAKYEMLCLEEKIVYLVLKSIKSMKEYEQKSYGFKKITDILKGTESKFIMENGHQHNPCFGVFSEFSRDTITHFIEVMLDFGLLGIDPNPLPVLIVTEWGMDHLTFKEEGLYPIFPYLLNAKHIPPYDKDLYEHLFNCRKVQARDEGIPPYCVIPNAALTQLSSLKPEDVEAVSHIKGFGTARTTKYGELFINAIKEFEQAQQG